MKKVVVYGATENLYRPLATAVNSLLINNDIDQVYLLIEHDSFPFPLPWNVQTVNVKGQAFFAPDSPNVTARWTFMTLMRVVLSKLFPDEERALWLDCDTIVDANIEELFSLDMGENYFAGVRETTKSTEFPYINAGVLLENLDAIRRDGIDDRLVDFLNYRKLQYPDQDAINKVAQGKILPISGKYNVCVFTEYADSKKIYHFPANRFFMQERMFKKYEGGLE